ncbi:type III pantothenate kinase [Rhodohalobacter sp. 8-1]|uniref:type III pantothenate kinase n=1 Tax=Rhodohalobacter sp. 8-1 TaxID=3131972 RepID=UPI0030EF2B8E
MILVEIGNTSVKAVRDEAGKRKPLFKVSTKNIDELRRQLSLLLDNETILLSSVRKDLTAVIREYTGRLTLHVIRYDLLGNIRLDYETPETLGIDRVLACAGAVHKTKTDVIVVDAGTACTVDFMTNDYSFKGGVILPGLPMLRHAMKTLTPELPEVSPGLPDHFPGRSTHDAIKIGLNGGFIHAISRFVEQYKGRFNNSEVLITGGDGPFVQEKLEGNFGSSYFDNLVFDGMLAWKELNQIDN